MPVFERLTERVSVLVVNPIGGRVSKYGETATRAIYWTGEWAGGLFKPLHRTPKLLDLVPGHLAPTVGRAEDGRLRAIGIVDERRSPASQERAGWANTFSLPRVWTLMPDGQSLGQAPAPELVALRGAPRFAATTHTLGMEAVTLAEGLHAYELQLDLDQAGAGSGPIAIEVMSSADGRESTQLLFDPALGQVTVDKSRSSLAREDEGPQLLRGSYASDAFGAMRTLRVFVDGSVIEVFVNDAAAFSVRSYPSLASSTQLRLRALGTPLKPVPVQVQMWPLRRPSG
jgi:beta-fructofuranosidase